MLPGRTSYSTLQPGITNFKLNTINRTSLNVENPLNQPSIVVTDDTTTLYRGQTYTVIISHSEDAQFFQGVPNNLRVWIDYNADFDFTDVNELAVLKANRPPGTIDTSTFTVPMNATLGYTRLRATAKMGQAGGHELPTSCDDPPDPLDYHGEMEDYTVKIADAASVYELNGSGNNISIYPNPTNGEVTVSFNNIPSDNIAISLYDVTGKQVAVLMEGKAQSTSYIFDLNDHKVAQGAYFIKVDGAYKAYRKVIKMD
jgi:hypothetical protein